MALPNPAPPPKKSGFSPEIMQTLQKQNAPAKQMSPQEIIKADVEKSGSPMPWQNVYAGLVTAVKSPKFRIIRANNSLFAFSIDGKGMATGHLITADNPQTVADSVKQFMQAMKKAGYRQIKSSTSNPKLLEAYKAAGVKVQQSMGQHAQGGQASPAINILIEV